MGGYNNSVGTRGVVRINMMDWPSLSSAISENMTINTDWVDWNKGKDFVVTWTLVESYTRALENYINISINTDDYLKHLLYTNVLGHSSSYNHCNGRVEIKYYEVPGYNSTGPALSKGTRTGNTYPAIQGDVRAHIGTSNLIWDYFYTTAGVSFGTCNIAIVSQLQQIFDADWNSPYAVPVEPLQGLASAS
ncbi:hypothetical protein Cgig2_006700 [Carnegiea gigantea]|uniref:Uncharacterized protein n=1 Tax=Carnegiea gigantea TaxID=171969 RepID=A0A9Q1JSH4_9CARY|nr:hypothetical protein Cgig2_006700 [Carnegiea gigantea]